MDVGGDSKMTTARHGWKFVILAMLSGCALFPARPNAPNPVIAPKSDFETVYNTSVQVVDEYFEIASENRLSRTIKTQPLMGATILEPWHGDSVGVGDRLESTLQTIRRFAIVQIDPAPEGGYAIKVEVRKQMEDLIKPDRQAAGRAVFNNEIPVNRSRETIGPIPLPVGWIDRGRDAKLEQVIANKIRDKLFLY